MPNNCYNGLSISGSEEQLTKIANTHFPEDENGDPHFDFNTLIQYPESFKLQDEIAEKARKATPPDYTVKDGYNMGGYDWCNKNWGTKWNAYDQEIDIYLDGDDSHIRAEFYTAWAPPQGVLAKLCELYPDVDIYVSYEEAGMAYEGQFENQNGELVNTVQIGSSKRILRGG